MKQWNSHSQALIGYLGCACLAFCLAAPAVRADEPTAETLHAALQDANPDYTGKGDFRYRDGKLVTISLMKCENVRDLTPLAKFDLSTVTSGVFYRAVNIESLKGLESAKFKQLNLERCPKIKDLTPLKGMPIEWLRSYGLPLLEDLSPLEGMPLGHLDIGACSKLSDLSVLAGMPMKDLRLDDCPLVKDISVIKDMKDLRFLSVFNCTGIEDYSVLKDHKLETLMFSPELLSAEELAIVRNMDSLKMLGSSWQDWAKKLTPEQFWARFDAAKAVEKADQQ